MYQPTQLHKLGIRAKKRFSQNFLIDQNILEKICVEAEVKSGDFIVEIGPGPGALTEKLLEKGAHVLAIEKDPNLAQKLLKTTNLEIVCADALTFPITQLPHNGKIVANLPYHITTPLIAKFVRCYPKIKSLTVMVQREVGKRMTAEKNSPHYSHFTLFLQAFSTPKYCFTVKPNSFFPIPSVHSCIVHLPLHSFPFSFSPDLFFQMTRKAFHQKRKMLRSSLKELYPEVEIEKILRNLGLPSTARPQELTLQHFAALFIEYENDKNKKKT